MSALFTKPLLFTVVSANQSATSPASNSNVDRPTLAWQSSNLTTVNMILDLGASAVSYDTVAVIGSNLRATDTVQVRTGTTNTGIGNYAGTALAAFSGTLPSGSTSKAIFKLSSTRTERYVRLDFVATSHPDAFVSAQRIVIGKAISTMGIGYDAEQGFKDGSVFYDGPGWQSVDEYPVLPYWKFSVPSITDTSFRADWFPFLQSVGTKKAILFIPDDATPANYQTDALFGRITGPIAPKIPGMNYRVIELTISGLAQ